MSWHELTVTLELAVLDAAILVMSISVSRLNRSLKIILSTRFMGLVGPPKSNKNGKG